MFGLVDNRTEPVKKNDDALDTGQYLSIERPEALLKHIAGCYAMLHIIAESRTEWWKLNVNHAADDAPASLTPGHQQPQGCPKPSPEFHLSGSFIYIIMKIFWYIFDTAKVASYTMPPHLPDN